jgi:hypothetical protein
MKSNIMTRIHEQVGGPMIASGDQQPAAAAGAMSPRAIARTGGLHPFGVFILMAGAFPPLADAFIVNVALPTIDKSLHASPATLELIVAGYGVAYAAMLVLGSRLGDRMAATGCSRSAVPALWPPRPSAGCPRTSGSWSRPA